jgi:hypothetical protein
MKAPLMAFLILIALVVGSAVTVKVACENGHTACACQTPRGITRKLAPVDDLKVRSVAAHYPICSG